MTNKKSADSPPQRLPMGNNGIIMRVGGLAGNDGKREKANRTKYGRGLSSLFLLPGIPPRIFVFPSPQPPNYQPTVKAARKRPLRRREVLTTDLL